MARHGAMPSQNSSLGWRARPQVTASSKVASTRSHNEVGATRNAFSYTVVARNAFTDTCLRIAIRGAIKYLTRTLPEEEHSSRTRSTKNHGITPARIRMKRHGAVPSQISSPG